jgi:hypothetical protein
MIVGDSGMYSAGPALSAGLRQAGWRVVETEYPGMGLTRPSEMPRVWAENARNYHVDLTIVMIGLWDADWVASRFPMQLVAPANATTRTKRMLT